MIKQKKYLKAILFAALSFGWTALLFYSTQKPAVAQVDAFTEVEAPLVPLEEAYPYAIAPNSTLFSSLRQLSVPAPTIQQIVVAAKPLQDLTKLRPGIRFQIIQDAVAEVPELIGIKFRFSPIEVLELKKSNEKWTAEKVVEQVDIKVVNFSGVVTNSLWESAQKAKMDPNLIAEIADIFGWEVDFSREVRQNDRWRLTVEQKFVKGHAIGWGSILAAEYVNAGESHQAVLFRHEGEDRGYFKPDGSSLRRMFLKSPIRYGRITSGFKLKRFHPILQINRPHLGVDYAAPVGTPIRAVGNGTVIMAGWNGGAGNAIKIRHNGTYQTAYKHLSRIAQGVRNGSKVQQGQVIGYVGNTGLSTGPHLHFEFYQGGRYVDPLGKKFPSADPVPSQNMAQFTSESVPLLNSLPAWQEQVDLTRRTASVDETETDTKATR